MPVRIYAMLLISVIAAAGVSVALVASFGMSMLWVGLGALVLALALRKFA